MGIDRIGGGGSVPPEAVKPGDGAVRGPDAGATPFEVKRSSVAPAAPVAEVKASPALEGVRSGRLDVNGYVDAKVEAATAHLAHLTAAQRKVVGDVVRQQLLSDPHLADLVRQATGVEPPKADE